MRLPSLPVSLALIAGLALAAMACAPRGPAPTATPAPAPTASTPARPVILPADDAPHPAFNTEWWYYNGSLRTASGERYSFHSVVFDLRYPGLQPANVYQVAIADYAKGSYVTDQRLTPSTALAAGAGSSGARFSYTTGDWAVAGGDGHDRLTAALEGYSFDLTLEAARPPALHGGTGFLDFGPGGQTYYYSRTRMKVVGQLTVQGRSLPVEGAAWFDHQWGNFQPQAMGWDWFALQLEDGADVMLFRLRDRAGGALLDFGSVVDKGGGVRSLAGREFEIEATGSWTSAASGATYPVGWRIRAPAHGLDVNVSPVLAAAEFDATATTRNFYWEGPVSVSGSHAGQGFVEMVGYAPVRFSGR